MNEATEQLKAELTKNQDQIGKLENQISELEKKVLELRALQGGITHSINILIGGGRRDEAAPPLNGHGKYADTTLSDAIADVVTNFGAQPGLSVPEIITKLRAEGAKSGAMDFYASVYSLTRRLAKVGKIGISKKGGKLSFVRK